jgi:hypothetical protein
VGNDALELLAVVCDAAARSAQRERWANDRRKPDSLLLLESLFERVRDVRRSRSSAMSIASRDAAIISTLNFSSTPSRARSRAQFRPVCPPIVGSSASGRSFSMMLATAVQ